ncbi:MAG TPA: sigma-70 family RNA polymerase sigma factor [Alphaproteobacteria bacterium]|jgi:RNA polymerase sigma-70 factor (ECF subfamily)
MTEDAATSFAPLRPRLLRIAYRMLGSLAEAEDMVQEAYIRWHQVDRSAVRDAGAFLSRTVTRLCLDQIKSARSRREAYVGPWLPEPIVEMEPMIEMASNKDEVTLTLMMALERLSPLERAAFLLHDVFGMEFEEVAKAIDRDPAACRQLAARARQHVQAARPRFPVTKERGKDIARAFFAASQGGDVGALRQLLAADVIAYSDGGGKAPAALNPLYGDDKVARFFAGLARKYSEGVAPNYSRPIGRPVFCTIDGLPGIMYVNDAGQAVQTTALEIEGERIVALYITRNPDKLTRITPVAAEPRTPLH